MFTTYPQNYESLYSELVYNFSNSSDSDDYSDIDITISESNDETPLYVKRFYSTSTAELNIAPMVRNFAYPNVYSGEMGFVNDTHNGSIGIVVASDDGSECETRIFTLSRQAENEIGLVSTLPERLRTISLGESELLSFRVDPTKMSIATLEQYVEGQRESIARTTFYAGVQQSGFARFNLVANKLSDVSPDVIRLGIMQGESMVANVYFIVIDKPLEPTRVAWISSRGSIEHYTFPVATERNIASDGVATLTLSSAYETYDIRRALVEIIEAPKVWVVDDSGEYREARVVSESVDMAPKADIGCVDLKIAYKYE